MVSDARYTKRQRTASSKSWDVESEQEEHSLSLSQHSSPSQSDQEQTPVRKAADSMTAAQGFNLFKQLNQIPRDCQSNHLHISREQRKPEQCVPVVDTGRQGRPYPATLEDKPKDGVSVQNLVNFKSYR